MFARYIEDLRYDIITSVKLYNILISSFRAMTYIITIRNNNNSIAMLVCYGSLKIRSLL